MAELSLEIVEGPGAARQVPLSGPLEIGRDPGAGLVLDDGLASRHHARVTPDDGTAVAEDLESRNGTFVNGNEVHGQVRMQPGDRLIIGTTVLELRNAEQIAARPSVVQAVPPALAVPESPADYVPSGAVEAEREVPQVDPFLDKATKGHARIAPFAVLVLVAIVVCLYFALR